MAPNQKGPEIIDLSDYERILDYHDATKHHPHHYARGPGYLDWATQPNPFRRYEGAPRVPLLLGERSTEPSYELLFEPGAIRPEPVNLKTISILFECSLGLSAWKAYGGNQWPLRCNASSGNLHPTEGYLLLGPVREIADRPAVYHYAPREHELEMRHEIDVPAWQGLIGPWGTGAFFVGLSSIHWREAWKYGERAFRYCQHDVGHALAGLRFAAAMLGWRLRVWESLGDEEVARLLGLTQIGEGLPDAGRGGNTAERNGLNDTLPEYEHPDLIAVVMPADSPATTEIECDAETIRAVARGAWRGRANRLSARHVRWDLIDAVAAAACKPAVKSGNRSSSPAQPAESPIVMSASVGHDVADGEGPSARQIFLRRRSGTDYDGVTTIRRDAFYRLLMRLMPGAEGATPGRAAPWDMFRGPAYVHACLFMHLIDGLPPGRYLLVRDENKIDRLRSAMKPEFNWSKPVECPTRLPLFLLQEGDCRRAAAGLSLGQEIAGDSAFSLGMLAEFEGPLREHGPWFYRRLFWEAGIIGQVLYLEAEALAVRTGTAIRGTGIGAYFDDQVHTVLGIDGRHLQSLYHFTVGGAVDDPRLTTLPPYGREIIERSRG